MSSVSTQNTPVAQPVSHIAKQPWWRLIILSLLLCLSLALNALLLVFFPSDGAVTTRWLLTWIVGFFPYFLACLLVFLTTPRQGGWQLAEVGIILLGALLLRAMLLPTYPLLSHDALRYLWDARLTLHGFSPYVYAPENPVLIPLRDWLYTQFGFHDVPTLYPPAAQGLYILSYLLAPSNVYVLKTLFVGFDVATCLLLALLLKRRGFDPRRAIVYAWCPLPVVEFAIQGHVDAPTITWMVLAVLCAASTKREARIATGFFIALATLTKFYPILLLLALMRRRDYALLITCLLTIVLAYLPFIILGHGISLGFFSQFVDQHSSNLGPLALVLWRLNQTFRPPFATQIEHLLDAIVLGGVSLLVLILRIRQKISTEAALLVLIGTLFALSTHVFSWYTPALLVWLPFLINPIWTRKNGLRSKGIAIAAAWYFPCVTIISYFFLNVSDWSLYYLIVYGITIIGLLIAVIVALRKKKKGMRLGSQEKKSLFVRATQ